MSIYYSDDHVTLHHGDCLDVMRTIPDASIDAIVTDPPYGLSEIGQRALTDVLTAWIAGDRAATPKGSGFMGKSWDAFVPPPAVWDEAYRVLKPGGHLLAFAGSRTDDLMGLSIRLAGFEIRDSIAWMYAQGFPKSMNPGLDQRFCQGCEVEYDHADSTPETTERGLSGVLVGDVSQAEGTPRGAGPVLLAGVPKPGAPTAGRSELPAATDGAGEPSLEGRGDLQAAEGQLRGTALREVPGGPALHGEVGRLRDGAPTRHGSPDRAPAAEVGSGEPHQPRPTGQPTGEPGVVPEQRGPQAGRGGTVCAGCGKPPAPVGLGTALKPSFEPVVVARKPLAGTVASNVLTYGTGALNIDASRIAGELWMFKHGPKTGRTGGIKGEPMAREGVAQSHPAGRFPANVILDESQAAALDEQSGVMDEGGASRFFYTAKADSSERPVVDGVAHPTVKPLDLMRWLVRLVTPPGGVVLEPFAGSGTTLEAATLEGFRSIGIERETDYLPLIRQRLNRRRDPIEYLRSAGDDLGLFDMEEPA